jgi:hypothetical protein
VAPITAIVAGSEDLAARRAALGAADHARIAADRSAIRVVDLSDAGHNVIRYRPDEVSDAILEASGN